MVHGKQKDDFELLMNKITVDKKTGKYDNKEDGFMALRQQMLDGSIQDSEFDITMGPGQIYIEFEDDYVEYPIQQFISDAYEEIYQTEYILGGSFEGKVKHVCWYNSTLDKYIPNCNQCTNWITPLSNTPNDRVHNLCDRCVNCCYPEKLIPGLEILEDEDYDRLDAETYNTYVVDQTMVDDD